MQAVVAERHMLRAFGFVVHVEHPHRFVLNYCQMLMLRWVAGWVGLQGCTLRTLAVLAQPLTLTAACTHPPCRSATPALLLGAASGRAR